MRLNFSGDFSQFLRIVFHFRVLAQFLETFFVPGLHTNLGWTLCRLYTKKVASLACISSQYVIVQFRLSPLGRIFFQSVR